MDGLRRGAKCRIHERRRKTELQAWIETHYRYDAGMSRASSPMPPFDSPRRGGGIALAEFVHRLLS